MKKVILNIGGMSCSACSSRLEKHLNKQKGIKSASVNLVLAQALIEYDNSISISDIEKYISEVGFESLGEYREELDEDVLYKKKKTNLIVFGVLVLIVLYISMSHMINLPSIPFLSMMDNPINYTLVLFIFAILFLILGFDILKKGIKNLFYKSPNMDTLVTLGVLSSFIYSLYNMILVLNGHYRYVENLYFESCCVIIFFIKLGRFIDGKSRERTKDAIKELVQITPKTALVKIDNEEREVTIDEVNKGDILVVRPGMSVAVDGVIVEGSSHFDDAFITGESIPSKKTIGDTIVAGSINIDGYVLYKAERIGRDSTISEVVKLVVEASNTKAPIARLADIISGYFVPSIMFIAFITFIGYLLLGFEFNEAISSFVTVLVVACPCALGLATPLAIVVSEGVCAKRGILVKSSEILENASKTDIVVFDKTGTITYGNLKISKIYNYSDYSDKELLKIVCSIEDKSNHPIALAFKSYAKDEKIKLSYVKKFEDISGVGIKGNIFSKEYFIGNSKFIKNSKISNNHVDDYKNLTSLGNSILYVVEDDKIIGLIGVSDVIRDESREVISSLKNQGIKVIMLTGDNEKTARMIATEIGIDDVRANVLPKDKNKVIKDLSKDNLVMMIGDGINDAPSLASASIGLSIGSGTDIAANSASVILMNDNLKNVNSLISISKKTLRNIKQNLFWAFFYNVCMIPIAIGLLKPFGIYMNPMFAGIAMTISSLTVVFNSLRLKR